MFEIFFMACLIGPPNHITPPCIVQFSQAGSCEDAVVALAWTLPDAVEVGSEDPYLAELTYDVKIICQHQSPGDAQAGPLTERDA